MISFLLCGECLRDGIVSIMLYDPKKEWYECIRCPEVISDDYLYQYYMRSRLT